MIQKTVEDIVNKVNVGTNIRLDDEALHDTITSWLEEERDMSPR